jgi:hypothetical protein
MTGIQTNCDSLRGPAALKSAERVNGIARRKLTALVHCDASSRADRLNVVREARAARAIRP